MEIADDTALLGELEELALAEQAFVQTLRDWDQQEHQGKREKMILSPGGRGKFEVLNLFESRLLKDLGATHTDNADQWTKLKRGSRRVFSRSNESLATGRWTLPADGGSGGGVIHLP